MDVGYSDPVCLLPALPAGAEVAAALHAEGDAAADAAADLLRSAAAALSTARLLCPAGGALLRELQRREVRGRWRGVTEAEEEARAQLRSALRCTLVQKQERAFVAAQLALVLRQVRPVVERMFLADVECPSASVPPFALPRAEAHGASSLYPIVVEGMSGLPGLVLRAVRDRYLAEGVCIEWRAHYEMAFRVSATVTAAPLLGVPPLAPAAVWALRRRGGVAADHLRLIAVEWMSPGGGDAALLRFLRGAGAARGGPAPLPPPNRWSARDMDGTYARLGDDGLTVLSTGGAGARGRGRSAGGTSLIRAEAGWSSGEHRWAVQVMQHVRGAGAARSGIGVTTRDAALHHSGGAFSFDRPSGSAWGLGAGWGGTLCAGDTVDAHLDMDAGVLSLSCGGQLIKRCEGVRGTAYPTIALSDCCRGKYFRAAFHG